jgi:hypothetical protein
MPRAAPVIRMFFPFEAIGVHVFLPFLVFPQGLLGPRLGILQARRAG